MAKSKVASAHTRSTPKVAADGGDGLATLSSDGCLAAYNPAAAALLGLQKADIGRLWDELVLARHQAALGLTKRQLQLQRRRAAAGEPGRLTLVLGGRHVEYVETVMLPAGESGGLTVLLQVATVRYTQQQMLRTIQDNLQEGLAIFDAAGHLTECNDEWNDLLGRVRRGQPFSKLFGQAKAFTASRELREVFAKLLHGQSSLFYAQRITDGRQFQISVGPVRVGNQVTGGVATARDITTVVEKTVEANAMTAKAQRHLRELSQLAELTAIVGFKTDSIYERYLAKLTTLVQAPSVEIYNYEPQRQALVRKAATGPETGPADLTLASEDMIARSFRTRRGFADAPGQLQRLAVPIVYQSKSLGVILVARSQPQAFSEHEARLLRTAATRLAILIENATLYHEVNARRERWEAVFRFTEEGIIIFDTHGAIVGFNPAASLLTQYSISEALGRQFTHIVKEIAMDGTSLSAVTPVHQVLHDGVTVTNQEQLLETKGDGRLWTAISYSPIFDEAGRVTSGLAIVRNIQKDREIEEIKSDFISIVSHELRTPLTAIKGFLSMVLAKDFGDLEAKQYHYLSLVYQSNQRMIDLVEDLLNASNIESGKLNLATRPVALEAVAADVVSELAAKAAARQILIKVARRRRLPLVLADETRLHQILLNLVDNALKYSMTGTEITVDFKARGDELVTSISDRGVGISADQIDRLFTKFGRIYNPMSVQAGGTGLGLYIVKNLVESHGGRVAVANRAGGGTKFTFTLPIANQLPLLP